MDKMIFNALETIFGNTLVRKRCIITRFVATNFS